MAQWRDEAEPRVLVVRGRIRATRGQWSAHQTRGPLNLTDVEVVLLGTLAAVVLALIASMAILGGPGACCEPAPGPAPSNLTVWAEDPA